jgi:glutaminase
VACRARKPCTFLADGDGTMKSTRLTANPEAAASPIQAYLQRLLKRCADIGGGRVASYIPELAKADPGWCGIVIATVDGQVYEVGDSRQVFTLQSISKPLVYGLALQDVGAERMREVVGVEPSGEAFNSISLEPVSGRPLNPMINAGAIATASLVKGADLAQRLQRVLAALSAYAGRTLDIDATVYESERSTGHRNRAIGHMLRSYGIIDADPEPTLDLYFQQCSVRVTAHDLAQMAATLANGGVNPVTGARAVAADLVGPILSVMTTCGVYDFTGEWVYRVGLPAKSGVGGGIMAVLPGQLGVGVFSPPLDERGNSLRGVAACEAISHDLGLHFLQPPRLVASTVRARYDLAHVRSKRHRPPHELRVLEEHGSRAVVFELQGDLRFATLEPVLREVVDAGAALQFVLLDFKRVTGIDTAAARMLASLVNCCALRGQGVVLTRVRRGDLLSDFHAEIDPRHQRDVIFQPQLDLGLEWCETRLLAGHDVRHSSAALAGLAEHPMLVGAAPQDLAWLTERMPRQTFDPGTVIVRRGDPGDALYFIVAGEVSVIIPLPRGGTRRLATLGAGMVFGEAALLSGAKRGADVRADNTVDCALLRAEDFAVLEHERPALMIRLLQGLLRSVNSTAQRLTSEVAALEG